MRTFSKVERGASLETEQQVGSQPTNHSNRTRIHVLEPTGLLATSPVCSTYSDTNLTEVSLTCGLPLRKPQLHIRSNLKKPFI